MSYKCFHGEGRRSSGLFPRLIPYTPARNPCPGGRGHSLPAGQRRLQLSFTVMEGYLLQPKKGHSCRPRSPFFRAGEPKTDIAYGQAVSVSELEPRLNFLSSSNYAPVIIFGKTRECEPR